MIRVADEYQQALTELPFIIKIVTTWNPVICLGYLFA